MARFCGRCGADVRADEHGRLRNGAYAVDPGEPLLAVNVVSSLMPLAGRQARTTYRWALGIGLGLAVVAAAVGLLPFALAVAAVTVPVAYVVYLYDVNEWEDQPIAVLAGAVVLAGALAAGFTMLWNDVILDGTIRSRQVVGLGYDVDWEHLLVVGLLVPAGVLVLSQLGPLWLVARRGFHDLIDGLTFGVAAGATFAMVETFVLAHALIFDGPGRIDSPDAAVWVSLIVITGLLKPVIYGSAVGIAVASFSGKGERCDGFTLQYLWGLGEAFGVLVAFRVGLYLTDQLGGTLGVVLGLAWGLIVAAWVLLRVRALLQTALLESALEAEAAGLVPDTAAHGVAYCGECELPLVESASFCVACGASVRAAPKPLRVENAAKGDRAGSSDVVWVDPRPASTRTSTGVLVTVGALVIALVGALTAAINTGTRTEPTTDISFETGGRSLGVRALPTGLGPPGEEPTSTANGPNGITVTLPDGWHVEREGDYSIVLFDDRNGSAEIQSFTPDEQSPAVEWIQGYVLGDQRLSAWITDLEGELTPLEADARPNGTTDGAELLWHGISTWSDGTAAPWEGWTGVYITDGGNYVEVSFNNPQGQMADVPRGVPGDPRLRDRRPARVATTEPKGSAVARLSSRAASAARFEDPRGAAGHLDRRQQLVDDARREVVERRAGRAVGAAERDGHAVVAAGRRPRARSGSARRAARRSRSASAAPPPAPKSAKRSPSGATNSLMFSTTPTIFMYDAARHVGDADRDLLRGATPAS